MACYKVQEVTMVLVPCLPLSREPKISGFGMDCPLYVRSQELVSVPSSSLICDVSFIHKCGSGCKFTSTGRKRSAEREIGRVDSENAVTFTHDTANQVFYYNSFCLNNSSD